MQKVDEFLKAVKAGEAGPVARLIDEEPALVDARDGEISAILAAVYNGHPDVARLLAGRGAHCGFFESCALGDLEGVRRMIAADPSLLRTHSSDGYAPVGFATFFGHWEIDRFLIEQGADVNAQATNPQRVGAVHAAAAACNHEMLKLLLSRGADPNARQQLDYTPLHTAAGRGDVAMATLLMMHGADREARGTDGKSPAAVARDHGHEAFAEWLASYQAEA